MTAAAKDTPDIENGGARFGPIEGDDPPPGFVFSRARGAFSLHNGPFYDLEQETGWRRGLRLRARHCNGLGFVHGGLVMSFMDALLATAVWKATGAVGITLHMSSDFLNAARSGQWLEGTADVTKTARELAFARGQCFVGNRIVAEASGVFTLRPPKA
jgi:uncharacterized protein (TIGR00369 family)